MSLNAHSQEPRTYYYVVMGPHDITKPGTKVGLRITSLTEHGVTQSKEISVLEYHQAVMDAKGVRKYFDLKLPEILSLDEPS